MVYGVRSIIAGNIFCTRILKVYDMVCVLSKALLIFFCALPASYSMARVAQKVNIYGKAIFGVLVLFF